MIFRILLTLSLLLFVVLILMGTDPLNAVIRSAVVFIAMMIISYLTYIMVKVIGHTPEDDEESDEKEQQNSGNRNQENQQQQTQPNQQSAS